MIKIRKNSRLKILSSSVALAALTLLTTGCGGDDNNEASVGTVTLVHPGGRATSAAAHPVTVLQSDQPSVYDNQHRRINQNYEHEEPGQIPGGIDTVSVVFRDSLGNPVYGPIEVDATATLTVQDVPLTAQTVDIDYLRNGGFALFEDQEPVVWANGSALVDDPDPSPAPPSTSDWATTIKSTRTANAGQMIAADSDLTRLMIATEGGTPQSFLVKGVAYSPAPIGYNTRQSTDLGDFFWDTPKAEWFIDWEKVWKRDIEKIRSLGFNTIRVYNMIPYHINPDGSIPDPDQIPNQDKGLFLYQHQKFLDACWNDGDRPIYVLVGISMPDEIWFKQTFDNGKTDANIAAIIKFWDRAFPEMVKQVADHPAVLGFTIFNEKAFPLYYSDSSPEPATAQFWWSQVKKYTEIAKQLAPTKLVGWAANDDPGIPKNSQGFLRTHGQALDFFGVNGYQTQSWRPSLDAYLPDALGDLARPVILTEFGIPATSRTDHSLFYPYREPGLSECKARIAAADGVSTSEVTIPPGTDASLQFATLESTRSLFEDAQTRTAAGSVVGRMAKLAFEHPISVGITYFEWSDEWWKQEPYAKFWAPNRAVSDPNAKRTVPCGALQVDRQEGSSSQAVSDFPNQYWDEEGFGLHSITLNGRTSEQVFTPNPSGVGANTYPDKMTARTELLNALLESYKTAPAR